MSRASPTGALDSRPAAQFHAPFTHGQRAGECSWDRGLQHDPNHRNERKVAVAYKAEYIWIDGTEPTAKLRSKTKIIADGAEPGIWGFDGSSTNQAPGKASDCVLQPVFTCPGPDPGRRATSSCCARCCSPT